MDDYALWRGDPRQHIVRGPIRGPFRTSCCSSLPQDARWQASDASQPCPTTAIGGAFIAVLIAILALGFGHALSLTSEIAIVQNVARLRGGLHQPSMIGAYRLAERGGMVLGPIVAGMLAAAFGYRGAIVGIGVIVLVVRRPLCSRDESAAPRIRRAEENRRVSRPIHPVPGGSAIEAEAGCRA